MAYWVAARRNPEDAFILNRLANTLHNMWAFRQEATAWRKYAECDRTSGYASYRLGNVLRDIGDQPAFRRQAYEWLAADRAVWRHAFDATPATAKRQIFDKMRHWLRDPDFTTVRHPMAVAFLLAGERAAWQQLWAEVRTLYDRTATREPAPPPRPATP